MPLILNFLFSKFHLYLELMLGSGDILPVSEDPRPRPPKLVKMNVPTEFSLMSPLKMMAVMFLGVCATLAANVKCDLSYKIQNVLSEI